MDLHIITVALHIISVMKLICDKLEPVVESTKVAYLEKKMLSLKMKYYRAGRRRRI